MKTLNNFNEICNSLISEQNNIETTVQVDGDAKVNPTEDGVEISVEIPEENTTTLEDEQNEDCCLSKDTAINELKTLLETQLIDVSETSKTARNYAQHAGDDKTVVMYNYGFAEGQKKLIKFILKRLNEITKD